MGYFSMPKYFQNMPTVGKALVNPNAENETEIKEIEKQIHDKVTEILAAGITTEEKLNERGQLSAMQRINALVDEGTFCPLNSLFNPNDNKMGSTNIINGLGCVNGKWVYIIASDNIELGGEDLAVRRGVFSSLFKGRSGGIVCLDARRAYRPA